MGRLLHPEALRIFARKAPDGRIEPRATARLEDRVFFTTSPLPSDEHLEMLRAVVRDALGRRRATEA